MNREIKSLMTPLPKTIGYDIGVSKAKNMMKELSCHHLPVLNGGQLVGIVTERDLRITELFSKDDETTVEDIMEGNPYIVDPDANVKEVIDVLLKRKIGSVIVKAKDDAPWGIFTTTDALRLLTETL